ncbi:hypothetical protein BCR37DRAFT_379526 [Protomyces lactucae-debilis]|uniref:Uncharacterized protein n=1 Tax=Protomyces lactucae-debilis TaxID=2754530 RepID=A0A1Y2FF43_PROLT|nr:uncharacterized protein BCR37DRAFT_379526 [Protomyces lactucae-debilis]ORY82531.1 hypothetical protein BCR37DRAFT_379526 [Protomyces lactucae-debilis]
MSMSSASIRTPSTLQDDDTQHFQPAIIKPKPPSYLQRIKYQYDVNFGLYMLTPAEQLIINATLTLLMVLLCFAIYTSMPSHAKLMVARFWYYIEGRVDRVLERTMLGEPKLTTGDRQAFARAAGAARGEL